MKRCPKCELDKEDEEFAWRIVNKIRASYCRKCQQIASRECHDRNRDKIRERKRARQTRIKAEYKSWLMQQLSDKCCIDCGEDDVIVLQFDHVRGAKKFTIANLFNSDGGQRGKSLLSIVPVIAAEIAKCDVVCANCHTRRTAKSQNWHRVQISAP